MCVLIISSDTVTMFNFFISTCVLFKEHYEISSRVFVLLLQHRKFETFAKFSRGRPANLASKLHDKFSKFIFAFTSASDTSFQ